MIQSMFRHSVTVRERTPIYVNGRKVGETDTDHIVKCLVQPRKELAFVTDKGLEIFGDHVLYCDVNANIDNGNTIVFNGEQFKVVAVKDEAGQDHHLKINLRQPDYGSQRSSPSS